MTMAVHHEHTPGNPVLIDGVPTRPHCSLCGVAIVHNQEAGRWQPARSMVTYAEPDRDRPVHDLLGEYRCRHCARPVSQWPDGRWRHIPGLTTMCPL